MALLHLSNLRAALAGATLALAAAVLSGCATRSDDVRPTRTSADAFAYWDCDRLYAEADRVQQRAADLAWAVDARAGNNVVAMTVGLAVFWPALMAVRPDGLEAIELAELKGRHEALAEAMSRRGCPPPPQTMDPQRASRLPLAVGERLVYEERLGNGLRTQSRELGLRLAALRRDQLEFTLDLAGQAASEPWRQDLAGNVLSGGAAVPGAAGGPVHTWRRLLRGPLELGQVLTGELRGPDPSALPARLRGQVVATGVQKLSGRDFDAAVIELFGEAPAASGDASVRLDGSMAVDRASGVLLRLDLRSANPDFALRRRLQRVDTATP